jgi:DnaD/phage-associated family protein
MESLNGIVEVDKLTTPLPEITTKITTDIKTLDDDNEPVRIETAYSFFEQNGFGTLSSHIGQQIGSWIDDLSEELVIHALKLSDEQGIRRWKYAESILKNWSNKKVTSLTDVEALEQQRKKSQIPFGRKLPKQEVVPEWVTKQKEKRLLSTKVKDEVTVDFEDKRQELLRKLGVSSGEKAD